MLLETLIILIILNYASKLLLLTEFELTGTKNLLPLYNTICSLEKCKEHDLFKLLIEIRKSMGADTDVKIL